CAAALLAAPGLAGADEETEINKLKRAYKEEKFAALVGEAVVNAAHPSGKKVAYLKHELTDDKKKEKRKVLTVKMEYFGAVSGKRYVAEIDVKFEIDKDSWEVIDIDYTDNNTVKPNLQNLQQLKRKLNQHE